MKKLTLGFAGTPDFGCLALEALYHGHHHVACVYTQPDRPKGRGRQLHASPIKTWAQAHDIPVFQPPHFKALETQTFFKDHKLDLLVVIAYGLILPSSILTAPHYGCINVHASLLPQYRGASPIQQAILAGDTTTGVTIMQMDQTMDTGDILTTCTLPIEPHDTTQTLHDKLAKLAITPLLETIDRIALGTQQAIPQDHTQASYTHKITKEAARISWHESAKTLDAFIRAYQPWPVAYTHCDDMMFRIHQAYDTSETSEALPGTIVRIDQTGLYVATGTSILNIQKIQSPSKQAHPIATWLSSNRKLHVGMRFT